MNLRFRLVKILELKVQTWIWRIDWTIYFTIRKPLRISGVIYLFTFYLFIISAYGLFKE